ncbi:MAG: hypothetical protein FWH08_05275 [Oscillospiraceae bacterium]|nr:hypothetical protein [Oscillospiraceae bacterium]
MTIGSVGSMGNVGTLGGSVYTSPVDSVRRNNNVEPEQGNIQSYSTERTAPRTDTVEQTGERPDFATINFLRNSFPEPLPESRLQNFSIEDFINGASSTAQSPVVTPDESQTTGIVEAYEPPDPNLTPNTQTDIYEIPVANSNETVGVMRQIEETVSQSATVQTADDIAERDSGGRLTPAQERGVEVYTRVQNYTDPVSVSNAQFIA